MTDSKWALSKALRQGEQIGKLNRSKEMAKDMFISGEDIEYVRKYSKLEDKDLADILRSLPQEIQSNYNLQHN